LPTVLVPRLARRRRVAGQPVIVRIASGSVRMWRSFTYRAMTRGKFPKLRGCGSPVSSGTPICATAPASLPMLAHGNLRAVSISCSPIIW
jgi:hypothetical protein